MTELKDKTVLITGASAGIGRACARKFAEQESKLILVARRIDKLKELSKSLDVECHLIELDVRDSKAVKNAFASLSAVWNDIDLLINNAGLSRGLSEIQDGDISGWEEMIDTNIKGLLYVSRAIIPKMVEKNKGHIINIGSIAGHEVYPKGNVYCATKHAVDALTKGMRIDLSGTNVKVSTVDPGLVETEFSLVRFYGDQERAEKVYKGFKALEPDDIGDAVVWVANRPDHVQIAEIIILPKDQASSTIVSKNLG